MRNLVSRCLLGSLALTSSPQSATIQVPGDYSTIQGAIDASADGDLIEVAAGSYMERIDYSGKAVTVNGAGATSTWIFGVEDSHVYGGIMLFQSGEVHSSVLRGFTLNSGYSHYGGALAIIDSSPTIDECAFTGNRASLGGGALYVEGGAPKFTDSTFSLNSSAHGGAIHFNNASPRVYDCSIEDNTSGGGYYLGGAGMYMTSGSAPIMDGVSITNNFAWNRAGGIYMQDCGEAKLTRCDISNNEAMEYGGGGYLVSSTPYLWNCTFDSNVTDSEGGGLSIYGDDGEALLEDCEISNNFSESSAGGIKLYGGSHTMTRCDISNNTSNWFGGGVVTGLDESPHQIQSCKIMGNQADVGGGMWAQWGVDVRATVFAQNTSFESGAGIYCNQSHDDEVTLVNCVVADNFASTGSGGIRAWSDDGPVEVRNSIIWGNSSPQFDVLYSDLMTAWYCDISGTYPGLGNISKTPLFGPIRNSYKLQKTSPCIDAGWSRDSDACRPPGLGLLRSDMGAYAGGYSCSWNCDLKALATLHPSTVSRGETLSFRANASNACDSAESLDEAVLQVSGPASLTRSLYSGGDISVSSDSSVGANVSLGVPAGAPAGVYTLSLELYLDGELLSSDEFTVEVL